LNRRLDSTPAIERLTAEGVISCPTRSTRPFAGAGNRPRPKRPVADLVTGQRRYAWRCADSSALVKLVVDEVGSDIAAALWNAYDVALSSRLAYPEVAQRSQLPATTTT
jgi:hypothetical protein